MCSTSARKKWWQVWKRKRWFRDAFLDFTGKDMFEKFIRALAKASAVPNGRLLYWQEALLHRFGKECDISCPSSLRRIIKIFEADIKRISKVANDTQQLASETTMDIATVRPKANVSRKPCRDMFVVKIFENNEERFGAIKETIANDDYNIVCAMSAGPYLLDSYATRFEQLVLRAPQWGQKSAV